MYFLRLPQKMWILLSAFLFIVVSAQAVTRKTNHETPFVNGVNASNLATDDETVTITRNLTKDRWVTLVLPYNVSDLNNLNGLKCEALEYDDLKVKWDNNTCYINLLFTTVDRMWSGYPYLFRVVEFPDGGDSGELTVYKGPMSDKPTEVDIITRTIVTEGISVLMRGTYDGCTLDVGDGYTYFYFGYDPQAEVPYNFYIVDQGTVDIGFSLCYFKIENVSQANSFNLSFGQDATKINQVKIVVDNKDDKVYNLNGQQVTGNLSKGIYIMNGKKVLVK